MLQGLVVFLAGTAWLAAGADEALGPWTRNHHPTDAARSHVEEITAATHPYTVRQEGTMDGRNCRSPMGCGMSREGALLQTWESNRSVRMENVGDDRRRQPVALQRPQPFRTVGGDRRRGRHARHDRRREGLRPLVPGDPAIATIRRGDNNELGDPVKVFNVYGYNTCGNDSISLATLWRKAGLQAAPARALGHCISQALYEDRWHFYDGDLHSVYLLRDNQTVASEQDIVRDHDLVKRTHSQGILLPDTWWDGPEHVRDVLLRGRSERRARRQDRHHDEHGAASRRGHRVAVGAARSAQVSWRVAHHARVHGPDLQRPVGISPRLRPGDLAAGRRAAWRTSHPTRRRPGRRAGHDGHHRLDDPQPVRLRRRPAGSRGRDARFSLSADGKTWQSVQDNLDKLFSVVGRARYRYQLQCQLEGAARLRRLAIVNDVQMAPLALPEMAVGENTLHLHRRVGRAAKGAHHAPLGRAVGSRPPRRRPRPSIRPTAARPKAPTSSSAGRRAGPGRRDQPTTSSSSRAGPTCGCRCR